METEFSKGDKVRIIGSWGPNIGIIDEEPQEISERIFYSVSLDPSQQSSFFPKESLVSYTPSSKPVEALLENKEFSPADDFIQTLIYKKLEKPLSDNLYTFYASRTEFQVHQFKPVLKFLSTPKQRLLLADEVGLGKTIEAGIIITELSARLGGLPRVLVVCPSMLTQKWFNEMERRFSINFDIMDRSDFEKFLQRYIEYGEAEQIKGIISLQTLRSRGMIDILRETSPHFDIVVVDEAAYMRNPRTLSSELGETLSECADAMLFLSATPLQMGTPDLFNLLALLVPEEFSDFSLFSNIIEPNEYINDALRRLYDPEEAIEYLRLVEETSQRGRFINNPYYKEAVELLRNNINLTKEQGIKLQKLLIELNCLSYIFTRTKKRDVETQFPIREARVIRVPFSELELRFYNAVTTYVTDCYTARMKTPGMAALALINPQRQVASSIQAYKNHLKQVVKKKGDYEAIDAENTDLGYSDDDCEERLELTNKEITARKSLLAIANEIGQKDTKYGKFLDALRSLEEETPDSKIMVFAYYKKTLEYLRQMLETTEYEGRIGLIHGDIDVKDRQKIISDFRNKNKIKILLSSEVGGEGLDFEFCNVLFNYDLPWNPMRVEQRIGRLDRFGQKSDKILIYNFSMEGTIDDEILNRLYMRINIFERYIGDLDAILGDHISELTKEIFKPELTQEQKIAKIEKVGENIARKKVEMEEFENECRKFIGQDEYFTQQITKIIETKRFITAIEVETFLRHFINKNYNKTTLKAPKRGRENVWVLKSDDGFREFFRRYSSRKEGVQAVESKLDKDNGVMVTFNDGVACRDANLEFITIYHPIMKAIKKFYDDTKQANHCTAQLVMNGKGKYKGKYIFIIYMLEMNGLKKDIILIPVLVNYDNIMEVNILDEMSDWFMSEIIESKDIGEEKKIECETDKIQEAIKEAMICLEVKREEEENKLSKRNNTLVDNQIESVRQAADIKISKAEEMIRKRKVKGAGENDSIIKMQRGRIRKLMNNRDVKVQELEGKRDVTVGFNIVAGGLVTID